MEIDISGVEGYYHMDTVDPILRKDEKIHYAINYKGRDIAQDALKLLKGTPSRLRRIEKSK